MLELFNSSSSVVITHDDEEDGLDTHFLDLRLVIKNNKFTYCTYRKPSCSYNYVPFYSCHPLSTKQGIIATECVRLSITNSTGKPFDFQVSFFFASLNDRGYDMISARRIAAKYTWNRKAEFMQRKVVNDCEVVRKIVAFRIPYSDGAADFNISAILAEHAIKLDTAIISKLRFITCYLANKNLFRLRFRRFVKIGGE